MRKIIQKLLVAFFCLLMLVPGKGVTVQAGETGIRATAISSSRMELSWSVTEGAFQYKVYRSNSLEGGYSKLGTTGETVYLDKSVKAGKSYYYRIVPVEAGTKQDMEHAVRTVKAKTPEAVAVTKISVKSPTKVKLYWNTSKGANGYEIYRSGKKEEGYILAGTVKGRENTVYTDNTIVPGRTYYYKILPTVSNNGVAGKGSFSAPIKVKTVAKTEITGISSLNSGSMQLVWKKVSNAEGYEIYRSTKKDSGYKKIASLRRNADKYTDKSVKAGKKYYYKVVTVGKLNGKKITSGYSNPVSNRALSRVKISSANSTLEDAVKIKWKKVTGATKYKIYRATSSKGSYKHIATVKSNGKDTQSYTDKKVTGGKNYYYKVQAYSSSDGIIAAGKGDKSEYKKATLNYAIMGKSTVTVDQMVKFYNMSGKKYPSIYKDKGAKNIKKFCEILLDESEREGVRAEVIFAQVCLETGYLSFGGQVSAGQCNFSGLGATDDGAAGATFKDVRTGLRAQVQHLKGYASKDSLNQKCVDPRFQYLTHRRGSTPYVQNLGNGNWATDPNYASKLMTLIKKMKSC
ncbi:glucosaminidase domain-containing protein [Lachnospiraceae bacterium 38-14]|nr:glucosaminidase domain-containing protein [Lachnospiraceae bacterium]